MNDNIFAYTETEYQNYPAYISVNKRDGKYFISVRSRESAGYAEMEIPFIELLKLGSACSGILNLGED